MAFRSPMAKPIGRSFDVFRIDKKHCRNTFAHEAENVERQAGAASAKQAETKFGTRLGWQSAHHSQARRPRFKCRKFKLFCRKAVFAARWKLTYFHAKQLFDIHILPSAQLNQ
jgi:hypothetical protein